MLVALVVSFAATHFKPTIETTLGSGTYHLWIADTSASRKQGLSGVKNLKPNAGLLMVYPDSDYHGIWMKDMEVALDILWLDEHKKIVYIVKNVSPEYSTSKSFKPNTPALYVIELPAGSVQKAGIKTGQVAGFTLEGGE